MRQVAETETETRILRPAQPEVGWLCRRIGSERRADVSWDTTPLLLSMRLRRQRNPRFEFCGHKLSVEVPGHFGFAPSVKLGPAVDDGMELLGRRTPHRCHLYDRCMLLQELSSHAA